MKKKKKANSGIVFLGEQLVGEVLFVVKRDPYYDSDYDITAILRWKKQNMLRGVARWRRVKVDFAYTREYNAS